MKTVLITGCSSGYGLETARHFLARGWSVIATMRSPREELFPETDRCRLLALNVPDPASIAAAISAAGPIDVLVNNAGIGVVGAFEATPMDHIRKVFDTNTFGTNWAFSHSWRWSVKYNSSPSLPGLFFRKFVI